MLDKSIQINYIGNNRLGDNNHAGSGLNYELVSIGGAGGKQTSEGVGWRWATTDTKETAHTLLGAGWHSCQHNIRDKSKYRHGPPVLSGRFHEPNNRH